jgi:hypothetical protein
LRSELHLDDMKKARAGRDKAHDPQALCADIANATAKNPATISGWAEAAGM